MPSEFHRHDVVPTRLNHIKPTFQILLPPGPAVKAAFQAHETVRTAQVHLRHRMAAVGNRFTFVFYSSKYIKRQNIFLWCLSRIHKLVLWALKMEKTYRSCDLWITLQREIQNGKFEPCQHWYELFQKKIMFQVVKITARQLAQRAGQFVSEYFLSYLEVLTFATLKASRCWHLRLILGGASNEFSLSAMGLLMSRLAWCPSACRVNRTTDKRGLALLLLLDSDCCPFLMFMIPWATKNCCFSCIASASQRFSTLFVFWLFSSSRKKTNTAFPLHSFRAWLVRHLYFQHFSSHIICISSLAVGKIFVFPFRFWDDHRPAVPSFNERHLWPMAANHDFLA